MDRQTALKASKAFKKLLQQGYNEVEAYQVTQSQRHTTLNKDGKYVIFVEHGQGFQVFKEVGSHLS